MEQWFPPSPSILAVAFPGIEFEGKFDPSPAGYCEQSGQIIPLTSYMGVDMGLLNNLNELIALSLSSVRYDVASSVFYVRISKCSRIPVVPARQGARPHTVGWRNRFLGSINVYMLQQPNLSYRPARLKKAESIPRNQFLGFINVYKYALCFLGGGGGGGWGPVPTTKTISKEVVFIIIFVICHTP